MTGEAVDEPGIFMTTDVEVAVKWPQLLAKVTDAALKALVSPLSPEAGISAVPSLIEAVGSIDITRPPGEVAWNLAGLSFGWAIRDLSVSGNKAQMKLSRAVSESISSAIAEVRQGGAFVPATFLRRPTTLPLYQALKAKIIVHRAMFRGAIVETESALSARLDAAYNKSVFEVYAKRPELYKLLSAIFSNEAVEPAEFEYNWEKYRKNLIYNFSVRPVFGQEASKISLEQLYIPLRAYYKREGDVEGLANSDLSKTHKVCMLDEVLWHWVEADGHDDNLRLLGGGPGSGKSTTLKALAAKAAEESSIRPLFVPLQHIDLSRDLREAVNSYFDERTSGAFTRPPLSRAAIEDGPRLLIIFDGLDELARPGEAAGEVVNLFAAKLAQLTSAITGDSGRSPKVIVSGRMPAFQSASRILSPPNQGQLEVFGLAPLVTRFDQAGGLWSEDQRPQWWRQYAELVGADTTVPEAFSSPELAGITQEPLLCYLLVLSGYVTGSWEQAAENTNRIYRSLVNSIWDRGWGDGIVKRQGPGRALSKRDFNLLMQVIALAAWQGGDTRVATEQAFNNAIKIAKAEAAWDQFTSDNGKDVTNLAMNFYLKSSESSHRGFEFTHKSFGDYLAARAMLDLAVELPVLVERNVEFAMAEWLTATGTGDLSTEVLQFLRDEVRLRLSEKDEIFSLEIAGKTKAAFEKLVSAVLAEGLPACNGGTTWREAERRQASGETMAWGMLNSLARGIHNETGTPSPVNVKWPDKKYSFAELIRRVSKTRNRENPTLRCFSYMEAPGCDLFGLEMSGIDLSYSNLEGAFLSGCHLLDADLTSSNLKGAIFGRAMLDGANLKDADLTRASLLDTRLEGANLAGSNFTDAVITELTIELTSIGRLQPFADSFILASGYKATRNTRKATQDFVAKLVRRNKSREVLRG